MDYFWVLAAATTLGAAAQAATGFGFALLAAPIYLATMGSGAAIQVLLAVSLIQSLLVVPKLWRKVPTGFMVPLVAGSLVGFPAGLVIFLMLDVVMLKLVVGGGMLLFGVLLATRELGWLDFGPSDGANPGPAMMGLVGAAAGLLTAVLVTPGPPLILLNGWLRLAKEHSRALTLTFFAFCYVMAIALHVIWGGMTLDSWTLAFKLTPFVVAGTVAGALVAKRLSESWFRWTILAIAAGSGSYAILDAV